VLEIPRHDVMIGEQGSGGHAIRVLPEARYLVLNKFFMRQDIFIHKPIVPD
jgi:hypothetical protein